jgi:hypothetical protein
MPEGPGQVWCEFWLMGSEEDVERRFRTAAAALGVRLQSRALRVPERTVVLGIANLEQLHNIITFSSDVAELRRASETATLLP